MPHLWMTGATSADRIAAAAATALVPLVPTVPLVDAHRRLRGPYTAAGTVLRGMAASLVASSPELARRHTVEILTVAPELAGVLDPLETLTSVAIPAERTRFYSRLRTRRIAHGLTELLRGHLTGTGGRVLVVDNVHEADPTDVELLGILARRLDPALCTLVVCSTPEFQDERLARHTQRVTAPVVDRAPTTGSPAELAARYVAGDCTSDDPALLAAYLGADASVRAALHDGRAAELEARGEVSLRIGAIPHHREHGGAPALDGAEALRFALEYCIDLGFYEATVDFGHRGRAVIDWRRQESLWWTYTTKMTTSLASLGRADDAEALYKECRSFSVNPRVHQQAAYATAMLYTRFHEKDHKDHLLAKEWMHQAIAITTLLNLLNNEKESFAVVFQNNGLALIELHLGNLAGALELLDQGIAKLDRELGDGEHLLHRSVLVNNRGRVLVGLGRLDEALDAYLTVTAVDPNYAEYHFELGNLYHQLGRDDDALAAYATAMRLTPPFPELFYNRADVLIGLDRVDEALADLDYVLELDPDSVDAMVNRAGLLVALGRADEAAVDVAAGLALAPDNAHLLCLRGQLHDDPVAADAAFGRALAADPGLTAAWVGRAELAFEAGDHAAAVRLLDHALEQGDDPAVLFNRAIAHQAMDRADEALRDLARAHELAPDDEDIRAELDRLQPA